MRQFNDRLRDYQIRAKGQIFEAWRHCRSILFQMPTGTGKTVLFTSIINDLNKESLMLDRPIRFLIVAHRRELLMQIKQTLNEKFRIKCGIIQASQSERPESNVQVASVQTLFRRKDLAWMQMLHPDYIFIDEAHHSVAMTYKMLWDSFPTAKKLGVTATPCRLDRRGFSGLYDRLIVSPDISWFLKHNYLCEYEYVSIRPDSWMQTEINSITKFGRDRDFLIQELDRRFNNSAIRARLLKAYLDFAKGRKGIIYAINVEHARQIATMYSGAGFRAVYIHCQTPAEERSRYVKLFRESRIDILVNVDIFSEGFDCPDVEFIQLARPTRSLSKYLQQVGRALRTHPHKNNAIILDNVGLYNHFGLPDEERNWYYYFEERLQKIASENESGCRKQYDGTSDADFPEENEEMVIVHSTLQPSGFGSGSHSESGQRTGGTENKGQDTIITLWEKSLLKLSSAYSRTSAVQVLADMTECLDAEEIEELAGKYATVCKDEFLHSLGRYKDKKAIDSTLVKISAALCEAHLISLHKPFYSVRYILDIPYVIRFAN